MIEAAQVLRLLLLLAAVAAGVGGDCSRVCEFRADEDTRSCVVLGAAPSNLGGALILWRAADAACLSSIKIKITALPTAQLRAIFPTPDGANASASAYANFLKLGDNSVASGLRVSWPAFFDGTGKLLDRVPGTAGTGTSCKVDANACWTAFKAFLDSDDAAKARLRQDGVTLWNNFRKDRELEQSTARINICAAAIGAEAADNERAAQIAACPELKAQIETLSTTLLKDARINGAVQCSSFGIGPGARKCDESIAADPTVAQVGGATTRAATTAAPGADDVRLGAGIGVAGGVAALVATGIYAYMRKRPHLSGAPPAASSAV
jgi:hypothetical protein